MYTDFIKENLNGFAASIKIAAHVLETYSPMFLAGIDKSPEEMADIIADCEGYVKNKIGCPGSSLLFACLIISNAARVMDIVGGKINTKEFEDMVHELWRKQKDETRKNS